MSGWVTDLMQQGGLVAVALLMFLENVFPPIPSEVIMPLAGFSAARGEFGFVAVIAAGTLGSLAGASVWYVVGRAIGEERLRRLAARLGRVLTLTPQDISRGDRWFDRYGPIAVLVGRLVPVIRTVISIPAGLSGMRPGTFLLFSGIGTLIWTLALGAAGYWLGSRSAGLESLIGLVTNAIVALAVVLYVWRFATYPARAGAAGD